MTLSQTGNLGLGVPNPIVRLHIDGKVRLNSFASYNPGMVYYDSNGTLQPKEFPGDHNLVLLGDGSFGAFPITGWTISGHDLISGVSGNIGIGITPAAKLDVNGNAIIRGTLHVYDGIIVGRKYTGEKVEVDTVKSQELEAENIKIQTINIDGNESKITSTTGSIFLDNNNLVTTGTLIAGQLSITGPVSYNSLFIQHSLTIGSSSLHLSSYDISTGSDNRIYSTGGDLLLQSEVGNDNNTIINANNVGKVGIGTDDPAKNLHLKGITCVDCAVPNPKSTVLRIEDEIVGPDGQNIDNSWWDLIVSGSDPNKLFFTSSKADDPNTAIMTLDQNGNIGLGTESPSQKLDVWHSDPYGGISINQTTTGVNNKSEIKFCKNEEQLWAIGNDFFSDGTQTFFIWDHVSEKPPFIIYPNGTVGIGIQFPDETVKLHVRGGIRISDNNEGNNKVLVSDNDGRGTWKTLNEIHPNLWQIDPSTGNVFKTWGKVFIGMEDCADCLSSGYDLFVKNGIVTKDIKVTSLWWADYVFEEDYNLIPIRDLEAYIISNKHLPGIPSRQEVEENNGYSLSEMQVILLEKVEELSLYIIDLQNQINTLNQKLQENEK